MARNDPLWMKLVQAPGNAEKLTTFRTQIEGKIQEIHVRILPLFDIDLPSDKLQSAVLMVIAQNVLRINMVCLWPRTIVKPSSLSYHR